MASTLTGPVAKPLSKKYAGRAGFNSPVKGIEILGGAPETPMVAFVPQQEIKEASAPRRGGVARVMNTLGRAVTHMSPSRRATAYQRLESLDVSYDADVSSVESFMAVHRGSPGRRFRPCDDETLSLEESYIGSPEGRLFDSPATRFAA